MKSDDKKRKRQAACAPAVKSEERSLCPWRRAETIATAETAGQHSELEHRMKPGKALVEEWKGFTMGRTHTSTPTIVQRFAMQLQLQAGSPNQNGDRYNLLIWETITDQLIRNNSGKLKTFQKFWDVLHIDLNYSESR